MRIKKDDTVQVLSGKDRGTQGKVIKVDRDKAQITYTSVLNADAYGARGTYRMKGTHYYELRDGSWIAVNP